MARDFRPDARESAVISKLDHAKEAQRVTALHLLREHIETLSDRIAIKLIERRLVKPPAKMNWNIKSGSVCGLCLTRRSSIFNT
jgi:hypothetical protein